MRRLHRNPSDLLMRLFWALMLLGHAPALLSLHADAGAANFSVARYALLLLSLVFFTLKLANVAWLKVPADRRSLTAFSLIVLALHSGVAQRALLSSDAPPAMFQLLTAGGGLGALGWLARLVDARCSTRSHGRRRRNLFGACSIPAVALSERPFQRLLLISRVTAQRQASPHPFDSI